MRINSKKLKLIKDIVNDKNCYVSENSPIFHTFKERKKVCEMILNKENKEILKTLVSIFDGLNRFINQSLMINQPRTKN